MECCQAQRKEEGQSSCGIERGGPPPLLKETIGRKREREEGREGVREKETGSGNAVGILVTNCHERTCGRRRETGKERG